MNTEEKAKEAVKCGQNFAYWLKSYIWIEDKDAGGQIRFNLWPSQLRILPLFLSAVYIFILKARQLGLTWLAAAYCLWLAIFRQNQLIVIISRKEQYAVEFLDRIKFMFDRLPGWMRPHVLKRTQEILHFGYEEKDSKSNLVVKGLNSIIHSLTTTPEGAQSMTVNLFVLDEASLIENIRKIWRSSKPGVDTAHGRIIVVSNPNKDGVGWPWFREWYLKAWRGKAGRIRHIFMPWWDHPDRDTPENRKMVPHPIDPKKEIAAFIARELEEGMDLDDVPMAYPASIQEAVEALTGSYFGDALTRHKDFKKGVRGHLELKESRQIDFWADVGEVVFEQDRHGILTVWEEPDGKNWENRYCIFSDISEGLDHTESVAYAFDRVDRKFIAKLASAKIGSDAWADELMKFAAWCGGRPMLCPERSGAGQTTVKVLKRKRYPRIYRDRKIGRSKSGVTHNYGWTESKENKRLLSRALKTYLQETEESVPDGELIDQCTTYISKDGKLGKESESKKDDCVIGAGGCLILDEILPKPKETHKTEKSVLPPPQTWRERMGIESGERRDPWLD